MHDSYLIDLLKLLKKDKRLEKHSIIAYAPLISVKNIIDVFRLEKKSGSGTVFMAYDSDDTVLIGDIQKILKIVIDKKANLGDNIKKGIK